MRPQSTPRILLNRWSLAVLLGAFALACSEVTATSRESALRASLNESAPDAPEVIINDEEWIDRTIEEAHWEPPADGVEPSYSVSAAALGPEPVIRVGVFFVDFSPVVTTLRIGGRDASDAYELRGWNSAGSPIVVSGLSGEVIVQRIVVGTAAQMRLTLPDQSTLTVTDSVALTSASGFVRIRRLTTDASLYRGIARVRFNAAVGTAIPARSRLIGINELPIEHYIKGVVPRELGPIAFPEVEAQKAQAVAARTFARRRMQPCPASRCSHGYHIIPTTSDQVYGGFTAEHPLSNTAVDGTRGIVGTYNGALIEGLYSSTSGGFTANSEDVFLNALPYLRGVPDHERGKALEHVPTLDVFRRHANPTNLRNHANGDFEADWSIFHRWYVHWTNEEMRQAVGRAQLPPGVSFIDPGQVYAIDVVSRSSSGRVFEMQIVTEKRGTLTARKDAVRTLLRYVTYSSTGAMVFNSLRSTLVYVEPEIDPKTKAVVGWEAWGGGWGHGTGMSQTGAVGMAEKGHSYQEILGHYYQGVVLEQRWE
jgi:stage II sporulation protein D